MKHKTLGAILLIAGTTIGAGTLAIPLVVSEAGFYPAIGLFIGCWFFMTLSALLMLEVNLNIPVENNDFISMAQNTLGASGKLIAWVAYLLLLYSLTAAYISAGSPWILEIVHSMFSISITGFTAALIFTGILALFVYAGTHYVDAFNRLLMAVLGIVFVGILIASLPHITPENLHHKNFTPILWAIPVVVATFGYHVVIPALTTYLAHDQKKLTRVILIGGLIPLIVYMIWIAAVIGTIPLHDAPGLIELHQQHASSTELAHTFSQHITTKWLPFYLEAFSLCVVITSFLGVSISLFHFLKDGFSQFKCTSHTLIGIITFLPPFLVAVYYPRGFTFALGFAGIFVALLLGILPILMAYSARYCQKVVTKPIVPGGKILLLCALLAFIVVIPIELYQVFHA